MYMCVLCTSMYHSVFLTLELSFIKILWPFLVSCPETFFYFMNSRSRQFYEVFSHCICMDQARFLLCISATHGARYRVVVH